MTWATEPPGEDAEASVKSEVWRTAAAKLQEQGRDAEASLKGGGRRTEAAMLL